MSVGFPLTKADLDVRVATVFINVRDSLARAAQLNANLLNTTIVANDTVIQNLGYTGPEVTLIRAALADLSKLNDIARAAAVQAAPNNFYFNAQLLAPTTLT